MRCIQPLVAWSASRLNRNGKRNIVFRPEAGALYRPLGLPCGTCVACLLERSRQWAVRCTHEASLSESNCFVTLTYDDEHLPWASSLYGRDVQLFLKRLRKEFSDETIRYFLCGEYGERFGRPHYHLLLFGFDFSDKVILGSRRGQSIWRSPCLERLWPYGRSEIGSVTFESAAYVARYVMKKQVKRDAVDELREPEFIRMSLKPGVGVPWIEKFFKEVYLQRPSRD